VSRRDFDPSVNARCRLCREVRGDGHRHPAGQVIVWLWDSHWEWRVAIVVGALLVTCVLAQIIATARNIIER
jgi:hypothetical protein